MCGRFTLRTPPGKIVEVFGAGDLPPLDPQYNIAPSQKVLALRGAREPSMLHWGLIPSWAADAKRSYSLINARAETVDTKPSFRAAFKQRRCLILADGFYEWKRKGADRQPFYIRREDDAPFAFAGLWERWERGDAPIESCTLLTTEPNELMASIHIRMPVILPADAYDPWLDGATDPKHVKKLLQPFPDKFLTAFPVSTYVNSARNQGPECIVPLDK